MKRKKIINLIIGTNNPGKLREIKDLLPNKLKIYSPNKLKSKPPITLSFTLSNSCFVLFNSCKFYHSLR